MVLTLDFGFTVGVLRLKDFGSSTDEVRDLRFRVLGLYGLGRRFVVQSSEFSGLGFMAGGLFF